MKHFQILQSVVLYLRVVYEYTEIYIYIYFNVMSDNEFRQGLGTHILRLRTEHFQYSCYAFFLNAVTPCVNSLL